METSQPTFNIGTPTAIVIAGIIIAGAVFWSNNVRSQPAAATGILQAPALAADISKVPLDGEPFIGDAKAPVVMVYWYDYQCPFCQRNEQQTMPQIIEEYVSTGKLKIVFKDYQFLGPDSQTLGRYSGAVWETAPDKFYEWHAAIYGNQGPENAGWATDAKIASITASILGVDDASKVAALVQSNGDAYQKEMDADREEGAAVGVNGTPGAVIGPQLIEGAQPYAVFKRAIDAALADK